MSCISVERFSISRVEVVDEVVFFELYGLVYFWGWMRVCGIFYYGYIDRRFGCFWCRICYYFVICVCILCIGNRVGDRCLSIFGGLICGGLCWICSCCIVCGIICEKWKIL